LVDGLVQRLEEVFWLEEVGDAVKGVVVDQNGAQKALLRLDIVRRAPVGRGSCVGREVQDGRISQGHGRVGLATFPAGCGAAIKRRRHAKRKQKLVAINRSLKWWMISSRSTPRA